MTSYSAFGWLWVLFFVSWIAAAPWARQTAVRLSGRAAMPLYVSTLVVNRKEGHRLVDSGPYAVVRHPIYSGILLAMLAPFLNAGSESSSP
jgi:protein-S-isoprenylcysteine O-methyltransferase Ste14